MSLGEIQASVENISAWKAILWCFYPMSVLIALELVAQILDDDNDQGGGKTMPVLQNLQ